MNKRLWYLYCYLLDNLDNISNKEINEILRELRYCSLVMYIRAIFPEDKRTDVQLIQLLKEEERHGN